MRDEVDNRVYVFCLLDPNYFRNIKWVLGFGIVVILLVCAHSYVSKFKNQIYLFGNGDVVAWENSM